MPPPLPDAADATPESVVADVLVPVAVDTAYSYRAPSGLNLEPGACVSVPLGTRQATGVVWAVQARRGRQSQIDRRPARLAAAPPAPARLHRLGGALDA